MVISVEVNDVGLLNQRMGLCCSGFASRQIVGIANTAILRVFRCKYLI
jgi:hypothetical protein